MTRKRLNFQWANDTRSSHYWVPFTKVKCETSPHLAKGQTAQDFISCAVTIERKKF